MNNSKNKRLRKPKFIAVDFFCGAGGTTKGLISASGLVLAGIDNASTCQETYERNNRNRAGFGTQAKFLNYDIFPRRNDYPSGQQHLLIRELSPLIRNARKQFPGTPLLFSICAPCQPFSRLAKQKVNKDRYRKHVRDRSLLLQCIKLVRTFKPKLIFSENVAAITSSQYGEVWNRFESGLKRLGYLTGANVVNTANFGIPQFRKRSILLAVKKKRSKSKARIAKKRGLVVPTQDRRATTVTVKQAIGYLPELRAGEKHKFIPNHATRDLSPINRKRLSCAKPGETNKHLSKTRYGDLSLKCHRRVKRKLGVSCFGDVYTRMHPDRPSPTITTRCLSVSNGRFGHYDPKQIRPISIREAAILQSFPSTYVFYPKEELENPARMIGNAVPPKLASFFARHLLALTNPK